MASRPAWWTTQVATSALRRTRRSAICWARRSLARLRVHLRISSARCCFCAHPQAPGSTVKRYLSMAAGSCGYEQHGRSEARRCPPVIHDSRISSQSWAPAPELQTPSSLGRQSAHDSRHTENSSKRQSNSMIGAIACLIGGVAAPAASAQPGVDQWPPLQYVNIVGDVRCEVSAVRVACERSSNGGFAILLRAVKSRR